MRNRLAGVLTLAVLVVGSLVWFTLPGRAAVGDISGTIPSSNGPEAGVWVIAETTDFDTLYRKIVVTDDAGRYVLPDLPDARHLAWVRGYYQDRGETHGYRYEALKQAQSRLSEILESRGIG